MIKVIPTKYNGYHFRSRLEARWAVFFDALGLEYEYEKEGFDLGVAGRYLPDFWLPELKLWCEIKGELNWREKEDSCDCHLTAPELDLMEAFRDAQSYPICLTEGSPGNYRMWFFGYDANESSSGAINGTSRWIIGESGSVTLKLENGISKGAVVCTKELEALPWFNECSHNKSRNIIKEAYEKARSARFEFGETPAVNRKSQLITSSGSSG